MTRSGISLMIAALVLQAPATRAAQLDKDSCTKLKTEQAQLEQGGTRVSLGKGPDWAKANLAPDKLDQVRRLIELDEQLLFRCGGRPLVVLPNDPDPAARDVDSKDGAAKAPPAKGKTPGPEKKPAVPLKKAAAPPADQPAQGAAKDTPPVKVGPQPQAAPAPANEGEEKKAAAPIVDQLAKDAAKESSAVMAAPPLMAPSLPAKADGDKKATVPAAPPVKAAAKDAPQVKTEAPPPEAGPPPTKEEEDKKAAALKAAKAKAAAKKKANDAYSASPTDWFFNPFASQGNPPAKK
jgi:hypothetical protein